MNDILHKIRRNYFTTLAEKPSEDLQFIVLMHIVSDVVELIEALSLIGDIAVIIAVPYSTDEETIKNLSQYTIERPDLDALLSPKTLNSIALKHANTNKKTIILEIGGYFANSILDLYQSFNGNLLGIIEDTESGHRRYEALAYNLPCPVYSVARSALKEAEDVLVGRSCIYATETILRKTGHVLNGQQSLVLGFGKIGRSVAKALRQQNSPVMIYDIDPKKRILALTEGYQVPAKEHALKNASFIFGTTGKTSVSEKDFLHIKSGSILISCSSKNIEFDLNLLNQNYHKQNIQTHIDIYKNETQSFYLLGKGQPINFVSDKCLVGPIISLIQGEMLIAVIELLSRNASCELHEVTDEAKDYLSNVWLDHFCDNEIGSYKYV